MSITIASQWTREQTQQIIDALVPVVEVLGGTFNGFEQTFNDQPLTGENFSQWANQELDLLWLEPEREELEDEDVNAVFVTGIGTDIGEALRFATIAAFVDSDLLNEHVEGEPLEQDEQLALIQRAAEAFREARDLVTEIEAANREEQGIDAFVPEFGDTE